MNKRKIEVLPLGCNIKDEYTIKNVKAEVINASSNKFILGVSTFEPRKNLTYLYKSFLKN